MWRPGLIPELEEGLVHGSNIFKRHVLKNVPACNDTALGRAEGFKQGANVLLHFCRCAIRQHVLPVEIGSKADFANVGLQCLQANHLDLAVDHINAEFQQVGKYLSDVSIAVEPKV